MKKVLLTAIAALTVATAAQADPSFGIGGYTDGGVGVVVTDDQYTISATYQSDADPSGAGADVSTDDATLFKIAGAYKMAVDNNTALTVGAAYDIAQVDGEEAGNNIRITAGVERSIASNVILTAETDLYTIVQDSDGEDNGNTKIANQGRVGVAVLF